MISKTVKLSGATVFYRINRCSSKNTLFFIHGFASDSKLFYKQMKFFSKNFRVCAVDLPFHGQSSDFQESDIGLFKNAIIEVIKNEELKRVIFICHSMGCNIVYELMPELNLIVKGVVFLSPVHNFTKDNLFNKLLHNNINVFTEKFLKNTYGSHYKGIPHSFLSMAEKSIKRALPNCLEIIKSEWNSNRFIDMPLLVIGNRGDMISQVEDLYDLEKVIAHLKLQILNGDDHLPFIFNSDNVNDLILHFISIF